MQMELFADIGDTVYFLDEELNLIYPMVVHKIQKSRTSGFVMVLVSTDEGWDTRFAEVVAVEDYNKRWFSTLYDAENAYSQNQQKQNLSRNIQQLVVLLNKLSKTKLILKETGTTVCVDGYKNSTKSLIVKDSINTTYDIPLSEIAIRLEECN